MSAVRQTGPAVMNALSKFAFWPISRWDYPPLLSLSAQAPADHADRYGSSLLEPLLVAGGLATGLLFAALILRLACSACSVDDPSFPCALGVETLILAATGGLIFLFQALLPPLAGMTGEPGSLPLLQVAAGLLLVPVNLLISAGIFRRILPVSFHQGVRIWLTQMGIVLSAILLGTLIYFFWLAVNEEPPLPEPSQSPPPAPSFELTR